jgi:hypothetical protein
MTGPEENENADNSRRDSSPAMSPRSSRFEKLLDQIPGDANKTSKYSITNSDTSRFDTLLEQIRENRFDQGSKSTDDE